MGAQDFGFSEDEALSPGELSELLRRLHFEEEEDPVHEQDHHATVAAVCEATGEPSDRVWAVLKRIREEDLRSQIEMRLREAEEPLHRVERPGASYDPLGRGTWVGKERSIRTILDKLPTGDNPRTKPRPKIDDAKHLRMSDVMGTILMTGIVLLLLALLVRVFLYLASRSPAGF